MIVVFMCEVSRMREYESLKHIIAGCKLVRDFVKYAEFKFLALKLLDAMTWVVSLLCCYVAGGIICLLVAYQYMIVIELGSSFIFFFVIFVCDMSVYVVYN